MAHSSFYIILFTPLRLLACAACQSTARSSSIIVCGMCVCVCVCVCVCAEVT